ncbi:MAG: hypothetical protein ACXWZU_11615 [Actinomycetota bacterium]
MKADRRRIRVARWTAPALAVLLAMSSQAWAATTDPFSSSELSGYASGGAAGWYVTNEQLAHTYTSRTSFVELVRPAETPRVEADLTLSTGRANAGLTVLWKDHSNHLWAKLEISPGNPSGIMTIGRRLRGKVTSLLVASRGGLVRGATYHIVLQVSGGVATFTATGVGVSFSKTISYRLSSSDLSAFGSGGYAGVRAKYLYDEDDGGSRWDNLTVG